MLKSLAMLALVLATSCPAQLIDAADTTACAIGPNGQVYAWGRDQWGGFGIGINFSNECTPIPCGISNATQIIMVSSAEMIALDTSGNVWQWGNNIGTPYQVAGLSNIVQINAGAGANFAVDNTGQLYAWGGNHVGQLGLGFTSGIEPVTPVPGMTDVAKIVPAFEHVLAIDGTGQAWAWGRDPHGQLGLGSTSPNVPTPTPIPGMTNAVDVAGGWFHSIVADDQGQVWTMGRNADGELGLSGPANRTSPTLIPGLSDIVMLGNSGVGGFAVDSTGQLFGWGLNLHGELGAGVNGVLMPTAIPGMTDVIEIGNEQNQIGRSVTIARDSAGNVYMAGSNDFCQLAQGAVGPSSNTFVQIPALPPVLTPVYTLEFDQTVHNGDATLAHTNGPANGNYVMALTTNPANSNGGLGSGFWGGLHITLPELVIILGSNFPPYQGPLDGSGSASFTLPAGVTGGLAGFNFYAVAHAFDGTSGALADVSAPIAFSFL